MHQYHIIGSSSKIAIALYNNLKSKNYAHCYRYSSKKNDANQIDNFFDMDLNKSTIIYFSHITDSLKKNLALLNKTTSYCKKFDCKFIYISSINAKFPEASYYSITKEKCELIVKKNNFYIVRLGLVVSKSPFGPYLSLINLRKLPIQLIFPSKSYIYFTNIESFLALDLNNLKLLNEIYDSKIKINDYFDSQTNKKIKINLTYLIQILRLINLIYSLKGVTGRLLTFSGVTK
jgi:hypothetical protein